MAPLVELRVTFFLSQMGAQAMPCVVLLAAIACVLASRVLLIHLCCLGLGLVRTGAFLGLCLGRRA